jgi:hypothetical protein
MPPEMRQNASSEKPRTCDGCGEAYKPRRQWQRFCGPGCRRDFHRNEGSAERRIERLAARVQALEAIVEEIRGLLGV